MNYQMLRDIVAARPKLLAFLAFLVVLNLTLFFYLGGWQRPELERARSEWAAKRQAVASGQSASSVIRYRNNARDLEAFDRRIIPKKDFPAFLSRVFQAAKSRNLVMKGVTYQAGPMKDEPALVAYGITFTVSGRYPAVKSFIADMEGFPEMVTLSSLSLNNPSQTEESVDLKMVLTAYLKREGA